MDKIIRIDMGAAGGPEIKIEPIGNYAGLGGRAMTSTIVAKEVPPLCHPLGADNKLVIAPGLLSGTTAAMSGRMSVGCKSPLTGALASSFTGDIVNRAEVTPPDGVDLDPTNNLIPDERHVTLAWGRDYGDVTPVKGIVIVLKPFFGSFTNAK